eukprot:1289292-Prymnesium_polylepis.1
MGKSACPRAFDDAMLLPARRNVHTTGRGPLTLPHGVGAETHTHVGAGIVKCPCRPHAPAALILCAAARAAPDRAPDRPQPL